MGIKTPGKPSGELQSGIFIAALTALTGLGLLLFPLGQGFERLSFDLPSNFSRHMVSDEVVLVEMDEASRREIQPYTGPSSFRPWHTKLLHRLKADGCKLVVLDVFLTTYNTNKEDLELAEALKDFGPVVLAANRTPVAHPQIRAYTVIPPASNFLTAASHWGVAAVEPDTDGVIRRHYPGTELDPSMPWVAASLIPAPITQKSDQRLHERWIRYYGPAGSIPRLSYHLAFDQAKGFYRNKIVFIGGKPMTPQVLDETDEFATPYSRWDGQYTPGMEILATTFLNLLHQDWLNRISRGWEFFLVLGSGILFGFGLNQVRPRPGLFWALLGLLLISAFSMALFWKGNAWFSWMVIAAVQIPLAWIASVASHTMRAYQEKDQLERELSTRPLPAVLRSGTPAFSEPMRSEETCHVVIPDHQLIRRVGQGAYGEVWLARNAIGTFHVVKIIHRNDFSTLESYAREFSGIQQYMPVSRQHPGLVHLLHAGRNDEQGYYYCVMEPGDDEHSGTAIDPSTYSPRNLAKDLHRRGKIPANECVDLAVSLADSLHFLHSRQLVHRDIKLSNIIFVNGRPKLADIGLVTQSGKSQKDRTYVGTEGYIAPEGPGTVAADIYSLGKVIYEASMGQDRKQYPELPASVADRSDAELLLSLNTIILKACEEDIEERYHSALELKTDLLKLKK